jgi:spore coat protein SA
MPLHVFGVKTRKLPSRQMIDGVLYVRCPRQAYIRQIYARMKRLKPALIQVENRPRYAHYLKRRLGRQYPVILSLHSLTFLTRPHISSRRLLQCLRSVDIILVNSRYLKEEIIKLDSGLRDKIAVNHLGVDPELFPSRWSEEHQLTREEQLKALGWSGSKVILFVGRLIPIKGVHHLLKAMPRVLEQEPDAKLLIVGGAFYGSNRITPYVAQLQRLARPLGDAVRFIPYVPHERVAEWFRLADTVVVPSSEREAFGLVNVEAMASGVPVVASQAGGMSEVIEHNQTGLLVPLTAIEQELPNSILTLLQNKEYAQLLGEQGRQRVLERFTWHHTAERLAELYHSLQKQ